VTWETEPMSEDAFEAPSRFWQRLGAEHQATRDLGADDFKRQQGLRYFNWPWQWRQLRWNNQARFLLRRSGPIALLRATLQPTSLSDERWEGVPWPKRDRWLYSFGVQLLWQWALRHGDPAVMALEEPARGGPFPVHFKGRLVSQDLANSALEVAAITRLLAGYEPRRILEVGAGYGRNAYALLHRFPAARYTIIDIEPALSIAHEYLGALFPAERLQFCEPQRAKELQDNEFDLVISISSLQEMTREQQAQYLLLFDRVAAGGFVYLKQFTQTVNFEDLIVFVFSRMPIPDSWALRFSEECPVQTQFTQAGWWIPPRASP
jgi:SAM-dependent methyltransferase